MVAWHTVVAQHTSGCMTYMAAAWQTWWLHDTHRGCTTYMVVAWHTWQLHDTHGYCKTYLLFAWHIWWLHDIHGGCMTYMVIHNIQRRLHDIQWLNNIQQLHDILAVAWHTTVVFESDVARGLCELGLALGIRVLHTLQVGGFSDDLTRTKQCLL